MKSFAKLLIVLFAATITSHAQLGLYGGFRTSKLDLANTRIYGSTFGAYFDGKHHPLVNFGIDVRGSPVSGGGNQKVTAVTAGPRIVFHLPIVPLRPYAEGLVGGAHVKAGQGFATYDSGGFAGGTAAGADLHLLPYIDCRVIDFSYMRLQRATTQQATFTTGIVFRVPLT